MSAAQFLPALTIVDFFLSSHSYSHSIAICNWDRMDSLTSNDQRKISAFVRELYCLGSIKAISERVVATLGHLINGNSSIFVYNDRKLKTAQILAENVGPDYQRVLPAIWALRHEHPGMGYHRAYAARAVTISDLTPQRQWRKTELFSEFYSKMGMHEQMLGVLPFALPDLAGVIINRTRSTFTQRDRLVLNILRFHISEACRTTKLCAALPSVLVVEGFESLADGSIVVLDNAGVVRFSSDAARKHLETFFPTEKPYRGGLPLTVERWVRREIEAFATNELAIRRPQPLIIRRCERSLHVRLAASNEKTGYFLLLRVEDPTSELKRLSHFGLGPRATSVLYWLAKGKTNEEIGIILGVATGTVKVHLKNIFSRLHVENRATAASIVSEFLARAPS